jgi:hypothetical protein
MGRGTLKRDLGTLERDLGTLERDLGIWEEGFRDMRRGI